MKVIIYGQTELLNDHRLYRKRTRAYRDVVMENDGSEDGGKRIALFYQAGMAQKVCRAMGWEVTADDAFETDETE